MMKFPRLIPITVPALSGHRAAPALLAAALLAGLAVVAFDDSPQAFALDNIYVVEAGDTLGGLAITLGIADEDIDDWIEQVVVLNDLVDADTIVEGQALSLPIGSAQAGQDAPTAEGGLLTPIAEPETYTVQDGDTLLSLAIDRGIPDEMAWIDEVVALNGLESADVITAGQILHLPALAPSEVGDDGAGLSSGAGATSESTDFPATYTVQSESDSLFDLAASLGIPSSEVNAWVEATVALNSLDVNGLYPGDVIQLPQPGSF